MDGHVVELLGRGDVSTGIFTNHGFNLSCDTPFTHAVNACVFRASWAKPRLFSLVFNNHCKNAPQCVALWLEIILFKIEITCGKKLKQHVATRLKATKKLDSFVIANAVKSVSVGLTPWVNFTNVLRAAFTYVCCTHVLGLYFTGSISN